jgi:hypothetical protein
VRVKPHGGPSPAYLRALAWMFRTRREEWFARTGRLLLQLNHPPYLKVERSVIDGNTR